MQISNVHKSIIVINSLGTCFFFEAVQKTCSMCFIGSKTTQLHLVVLNFDKTQSAARVLNIILHKIVSNNK